MRQLNQIRFMILLSLLFVLSWAVQFWSTPLMNLVLGFTTRAPQSPHQPLDSSDGLVRIIHQSWKTKKLPTKRAKRWRATWKACFPDWEHRLWTDEDNLDLVRVHYAWFLPAYEGFDGAIERADISRYVYLHHFGGIYTDLDNICIRNFTSLLRPSSLIFGGMNEKKPGDGVLPGWVQNSFMASMRPRHPFWLRVLQRIEQNFKSGKFRGPVDDTGPVMLMEELREYKRTNPSDLLLFPGRLFNPFSWLVQDKKDCINFGRMTDEQEKKCVAHFPDAYVVQFHSHTWGGGTM